VPPGAFLVEPLTIGSGKTKTIIPSGSQIIQIGGRSCRDVPFQQIRDLALAGTAGTQILFDDP